MSGVWPCESAGPWHHRKVYDVLKQSRAPKNTGQKLTFVLPADHPAGTVSVVGTFNDWTPGAHVLKKRSNGTASATITVPEGTTVHFRYLGENGVWFDEPEADVITDEGSLVTV
jgi:1,4-alpha-glucan branching enzyme